MKISRGYLAIMIIALVIIIDQAIKIWVKTHFYLGEDMQITSWCHLYFIQNNGMAFGMELGSKLLLSLVRIIAVGLFIYYICRIKSTPGVSAGYIVVLSLITAGAAGNIIDCVFYGEIFNNPVPPEVATMFPPDGGYSTWFHGQVVDMFYFPLFSFDWPEWVPWVGGDHFIFFQPVFNFADAAITVGIIALILFYSRNLTSTGLPLPKEPEKVAAQAQDSSTTPSND